ncbi:TPR repeat [Synechococcus sp. CC9902]|uniref:tetratricopeptide repeat protein n=1 Tax=Synechococcus sp. (strain CC9902) TaxID=316279 RepID=UPI00005D3D01|nr:tetratricopeptide repeat protein [Synechococcus sp. CC9902]ABB25079.1 TPR repeat [Synechococcus sp. CC9902]
MIAGITIRQMIKDSQKRNLLNKGSEEIEKNPDVAETIIKEAIKYIPEEKIAWFNLGIALHQQRKIRSAIKAYRKAIELSKEPFDDAINNLGQDLLLAGEWKEGFEIYEERLRRSQKMSQQYNKLYGERWRGEKDTRICEKLIIVAEQGYGDTLQFCRFVQDLKDKGYSTTLFCQEELKHLLRESNSIGEVTSSIASSSKNMRWCPLMSLPHMLAIEEKRKLKRKRYININGKDVEKWKKILKRKTGHKLVAIHWQGNPNFEKKLYTKERSMKFKLLNNLAEIDNVEYISIQKGYGSEQLEQNNKLKMVEGQKEFDQTYNFMDTGAVLKNCDLLISADSSVVHLAGAIGTKVWLALNYVPEWRWGLENEKTEWYEDMKLYRQNRRGNWEDVIQTMKEDLKRLVDNHS